MDRTTRRGQTCLLRDLGPKGTVYRTRPIPGGDVCSPARFDSLQTSNGSRRMSQRCHTCGRGLKKLAMLKWNGSRLWCQVPPIICNISLCSAVEGLYNQLNPRLLYCSQQAPPPPFCYSDFPGFNNPPFSAFCLFPAKPLMFSQTRCR